VEVEFVPSDGDLDREGEGDGDEIELGRMVPRMARAAFNPPSEDSNVEGGVESEDGSSKVR